MCAWLWSGPRGGGAVLDGWEVVEACTGCMLGCVLLKVPCLLQRKAALGSCCLLSLFSLSLSQLKQGFLVNPFSFRRPRGPPADSAPFGLLKRLWGPLKKNQATTALGERQRLLRVPWPPYCDSSHSAMTCGVGGPGAFLNIGFGVWTKLHPRHSQVSVSISSFF